MMNQAGIDAIQQAWIVGHATGRCLHVGCGAKRIEGAVNLDPNPDRAEFADVTHDVHELPAEWTAVFDSVVSNHVLQSLRDPVQAMREMARVLKPGGTMAHVVPDHRFAPLRLDKRHPYNYCYNEWRGPETFRPMLERVRNVLYVVTLEKFEEFDWSFKVEVVRL
jgi:ubiquinone/menaquinone biosynthesis C-methylase UbiE